MEGCLINQDYQIKSSQIKLLHKEGLHNWDMTMETPSLQANPHLWLIFELSID